MLKQIILYLFFLIVCLSQAPAQEVVTGLQSNNALNKANPDWAVRKSISLSDTLSLPFFDDFSGRNIFPDVDKWSDNYVFINNTYSDRQITKGVATFDALDNKGRLYETASDVQFSADKLTSKPLNLAYTSSDNIYLSFFYQAGGLSDPPEKSDSLILQFYAPADDLWYSVWRAQGSEDKSFKPAIIKIDNARYLKNGFRFRFTNYASLSSNLLDPSLIGNCDIWNVDYVLLNKNRNDGDTIFSDVAFTLPLRSLLKSHEAMPWKQFKQVELQEMASSFPLYYRNNDTITRNVTRNFKIWDLNENAESTSFTAGATNIGPLTSVAYQTNLIYTFNTAGSDSARFRITASLKTDESDPKANDTIEYYQNFTNYFAYDDGTAEGGYGINGLGSRNAMVAMKFQSFMEDTLRAITICFNDSYQNSNQRAFDLMVWNDNNGVPGDVLYSMTQVLVQQGQYINGFYTYYLPESVPVNDIFYIGWRQLSETFLNAGYDINTPNGGKQFYWINGDWAASQQTGTVMIRPIVGDRINTVGTNDSHLTSENKIKIWPNPAGSFFRISSADEQLQGVAEVSVIDIYGRKLINVPFRDEINISSLKDGVYYVITTINGRRAGLNRLIKTR